MRAAVAILGCAVGLAACTKMTGPSTGSAGGSRPAPTSLAATKPAEAPLPYIVGADISRVQQNEDRGIVYTDNGVQKDLLQILKDHGFNYIRFRVFVDPTKPNAGNRTPYSTQGYCDLPHTITMARRVKAAGMGLLIDFHYSDGWADPGKQYAPASWVSLSNEELEKKVHDWTRDAIAQLRDAGATPDMVQVGNEITPGMMTDKGGTTRDWPQLARYLKAGIAGVHEAAPKALIMLHIDRGGDATFDGTLGNANRTARQWVQNALDNGVEFDVLGLSCYTRWQGPPEGWQANFQDLAQRFPKLKFVMAEVDAQAVRANDIMMSLPDHRGLGTFIWEPTANNANQALFDNRGAVIPAKMAQYDQAVEKYHLKK